MRPALLGSSFMLGDWGFYLTHQPFACAHVKREEPRVRRFLCWVCMELLVLVPTIGFLALYIAYKEWLNVAHRQWLSELDLFKRRLAAYDQLKSAVMCVRANGAVSKADADRFAQARSDMRFLFDKDLEGFVDGIYDALLKKCALDALIEKADGMEKAPSDEVLIEQAVRKSRELSSQIKDGIDQDMPKRMEKFMRPRPVLPAPRDSAFPPASSAEA